MTIDQGTDTSRYQGLVALDGGSLEDAAHEYFRSSEQIPTRVRLAVGEEMSPGRRRHRWRAGGMLLQFLPKAPERARVPDLPSGRRAGGHADACRCGGRCLGRGPLDDRDGRGPGVDRSVAVERAAALSPVPRARRARVQERADRGAMLVLARGVEAMLRSFSQDDRDHMVENGKISVTCEFCSANYQFEPDNVRPEAGGESGEAKPET